METSGKPEILTGSLLTFVWRLLKAIFGLRALFQPLSPLSHPLNHRDSRTARLA